MTRKVYCQKLHKQSEGLDFPPYPNKLGTKIYDNISKQAWQQWLSHQTMLINEHRLNMLDPKAKQFLIEEMEKFFFGKGSDKPAGYVPPKK